MSGFALPMAAWGAPTPQALSVGNQMPNMMPTLPADLNAGLGFSTPSVADTSALKSYGGGNGYGGAQGGFGQGLGMNIGTGQLALGGLQTLAGLWSAYQQNKLAKQQFNYTKGVTDTNLANQIKSYNTALEDRSRSRGAVEGQTQAQMDDYVNRNRASRVGG